MECGLRNAVARKYANQTCLAVRAYLEKAEVRPHE